MNVFAIVIRTHGSVLWGLRVFDLLNDKRIEEVTLRQTVLRQGNSLKHFHGEK